MSGHYCKKANRSAVWWGYPLGCSESQCEDGKHVTPWFEWRVQPAWVGWYEIRAFGCDAGMQMFWNGRQWGFWERDGEWFNWSPVATDKWRGLTDIGVLHFVMEGRDEP